MTFRRGHLLLSLFSVFCFVCCTSASILDVDETGDSSTSILAFNPELVYKPEIIKMKAKNKDEKYDHLVLCHFSDIHGGKENLRRLLDFCEHYQFFIDDILHTGDSVADQFSDDFTFWNSVGATIVLNTIGNHDTARRNNSWEWRAHSGKDSYDRFLAPYVSEWGIIQPDLAEEKGLCYYYKDYQYSGIRLIVLDCMRYDSSQQAWLVNVLSEALDLKYAVIGVSHFAAGKLNHSFENVFDSKMPVEYTSSFLHEEAPKAIDSFIDNGGEFICWLGGHIHIDSFARLALYPRQICINVAEATCSGEFGDQKRVWGTKSQDLFNLVAVNRNNRELSLLRVGADRDVLGRYRFRLTMNY